MYSAAYLARDANLENSVKSHIGVLCHAVSEGGGAWGRGV